MTNRPQEDLRAIRDIMDRSRRFRALSGLSGIAAGIAALIGIGAAVRMVYGDWFSPFAEPFEDRLTLLPIATTTLVVAGGGAWFFTRRKMTKGGRAAARNFFHALCVPLLAGGLLSLILLLEGYEELLPAVTLVFYGLALIQASQYGISELGGLGWVELMLGMVAATSLEYSIVLWAVGFGLLHIAYGVYIGYKYRS